MSSKLVALLILIAVQNVELLEKEEDPFTNTWAAHIEGGPEVAKRVAKEHGYEIIRQVSNGSFLLLLLLYFDLDSISKKNNPGLLEFPLDNI